MIATRALGTTGANVPTLGLGTVKWGRNLGLKFPTRDTLPDMVTLETLLSIAREHGATLLDTAPAYGESEALIGALLDGDDRFFIATKAGEQFEAVPPDGRSTHDFSAQAIEASVASSCERLRRTKLDLVTIHADGRPFSEIIGAGAIDSLTRLKNEGTVGAIGYSAKGPADAREALERVDVLMITIHPGYDAEVSVAREAQNRGVGVIVKKAMASGHVADPSSLVEAASVSGVSTVLTSTINPDHLAANIDAIGTLVRRAALSVRERRF